VKWNAVTIPPLDKSKSFVKIRYRTEESCKSIRIPLLEKPPVKTICQKSSKGKFFSCKLSRGDNRQQPATVREDSMIRALPGRKTGEYSGVGEHGKH